MYIYCADRKLVEAVGGLGFGLLSAMAAVTLYKSYSLRRQVAGIDVLTPLLSLWEAGDISDSVLRWNHGVPPVSEPTKAGHGGRVWLADRL